MAVRKYVIMLKIRCNLFMSVPDTEVMLLH